MLISSNFASKIRWLIFTLAPTCIKPPLSVMSDVDSKISDVSWVMWIFNNI